MRFYICSAFFLIKVNKTFAKFVTVIFTNSNYVVLKNSSVELIIKPRVLSDGFTPNLFYKVKLAVIIIKRVLGNYKKLFIFIEIT